MSKFNNIASVDSKLNMIEKCYNDFIDLQDVDAELEIIDHKFYVLNNVSNIYD